MSNATLALALVLGALPLTFIASSAPRPSAAPLAQDPEPNIGDCRPDIGPPGQIFLFPESITANEYRATIIVTQSVSGKKMYMRDGSVNGMNPREAELQFNRPYFLRIDYTASPVRTTLHERGVANPLLENFTSIPSTATLGMTDVQRTRFVVNREGVPNVFDDSGLLQVYKLDGSVLTTAFLQQRP